MVYFKGNDLIFPTVNSQEKHGVFIYQSLAVDHQYNVRKYDSADPKFYLHRALWVQELKSDTFILLSKYNEKVASTYKPYLQIEVLTKVQLMADSSSSTVNTSTYTSPALLSWKGNSDYKFNVPGPINSYLCGVKLGSDNWTTSGVSSLWLKWCGIDDWSATTETRAWEDQQGVNLGANTPINSLNFGDSDCNS